MKKIISLVLTVCLITTMFCCVTLTATAATTISDIKVDLSKVYRIGTDASKNITLTTENHDDGSVTVDFKNYTQQLFNSDGSIPTNQLWVSGGILALKDINDQFIILQANTKYSINIVYDVVTVGTTDTTYLPQIGLARNNHASNTTVDNGTVIYTAKKHDKIGSYSISYQTTPTGNQPLRLAFGGQGAIKIKYITIRGLTQSITADDTSKAIDLTLSDDINVSGAKYSDFSPATATEPLKITVNGSVSNQFMDGTNSWANTWHTTAYWIKTGLVSLNYDASSHPVLDGTKAYQVVVNYKVTESSATSVGLYPEIAIVRNNNKSTTSDNGTFTLAATRIDPAKVGQDLTFTTKIFNIAGKDGFPLRLAFAGVGSFEVSSVVVKEISHYTTITLVNDGISTVDYAVYGETLPTPVKAGYTFKGWFDANGVKYTTVKSSATLTAAWIKNNNVDLTKAEKIDGTKATMTVTAPTDDVNPLNVTVQGFNGLLIDKETGIVKSNLIYTGGAAVALKYSDDSYVGLNSATKYIVNVKYDVTNIGTFDKVYHPQIAILYNSATTTQDNGQYILDAKKHSKEVTNASISCVVEGIDAKALRLAFDGQGAFDVKSVTITEMDPATVGLNIVNYTDNTYSTDEIVLSENGTSIADLPRTILHNFDGWYNGDEKASTVSGDVTLTAKWFDKHDVNKNGTTDLKDIVNIKKALVALSSDLLYDIDRDNAVSATDVTSLRKNMLGIESATINGNDISTYSVTTGDQASF